MEVDGRFNKTLQVEGLNPIISNLQDHTPVSAQEFGPFLGRISARDPYRWCLFGFGTAAQYCCIPLISFWTSNEVTPWLKTTVRAGGLPFLCDLPIRNCFCVLTLENQAFPWICCGETHERKIDSWKWCRVTTGQTFPIKLRILPVNFLNCWNGTLVVVENCY